MLKNEIKTNKKTLIIFSLILVIMILAVSLVYPSIIDSNLDIDKMIESLPKELLEPFNMDIASINSIFGWLATEGYLFIQLLGGSYAAILGGTILLKEKSEHTIDFLAVKPISKNYIMTNKILCGLINLLLFNIIVGLSTLIGLSINDDLNIKKWILLTINPAILDVFIFMASLNLSLYFKKTSQGISAGIGLLFIMYLLNVLATVSDKFEILKYINIFNYTNSRTIVKNGTIKITDVIIVLSITIIIGISNYIIYNRQETGI